MPQARRIARAARLHLSAEQVMEPARAAHPSQPERAEQQALAERLQLRLSRRSDIRASLEISRRGQWNVYIRRLWNGII